MVAIEAGQRWVSKADGSVIVVQGKSDVLVNWWKVRSTSTGLSRSIDEETFRTMYRLEPDDSAPSPASSTVATARDASRRSDSAEASRSFSDARRAARALLDRAS